MCRPIAALLLLPGLAQAAVLPVLLAPHRATYALTLQSSRDQSVVAASGSMVFDLQQACGGLVTAQHLAMAIADRDGQETRTVSDYATFEATDGTHLDFHSRQTSDETTTETVNGTASFDRAGLHGQARYADPEKRVVRLPPGTKLPNAHTVAILDAAMAGRRFLSLPLFDGTVASGAEDTFVTLTDREPARPQKWPILSNLASTRVHVAFFDQDSMDETPEYEVAMRYFDNGIADDLTMNFGDFVLHGTLAALQPHKPPRC